MNTTQLKEAVQALKDSSDFRFGDATSFDVCLLRHEVELPGKSDAKAYLDGVLRRLGVAAPTGKRCAVVCPGNGGLVAELLMAGAAEVVALEPRPRYQNALTRVVTLLHEVHENAQIGTRLGWPKPGVVKHTGQFDLILWPEGLEECRHPAASLESAAAMLAPGGSFVIEIVHGSQGAPQSHLNSWRPSPAAWDAFFASTFGAGAYATTHGRAAERGIYCMTVEGAAKAKAPAPPKPAPLPSFPRSKETDELDAKAEQPQPVPEHLPPFPKDAPSAKKKAKPAPPPPPEKAHLPPFPRDPEPPTVHRVGSTHIEEDKAPEAPEPPAKKKKKAKRKTKKKRSKKTASKPADPKPEVKEEDASSDSDS